MNFKLKTESSKLKTNSGFTLVETLVAIFIMLIAIVAPMSIASQSLAAARNAQDNVISFYLAQEGIELVRNIRDNNALSSTPPPWNAGSLGDPNAASENSKVCYSGSGCYIDPRGNQSGGQLSAEICDSFSGCPVLTLLNLGDSDNPVYVYTYDELSASSKFTRTITLSVVNEHEIRVSSKVVWPGSPLGFTITDNLQNWP